MRNSIWRISVGWWGESIQEQKNELQKDQSEREGGRIKRTKRKEREKNKEKFERGEREENGPNDIGGYNKLGNLVNQI